MKLKITVHGVAYEVEVEVLDPGEGFPPGPLPDPRGLMRATPQRPAASAPPVGPTPAAVPAAGGANVVACPVAGTVHELKCRPGDQVTQGQVLVVVEAMKMNTSIMAPAAGKVKAVPVAVGDSVREGETLVEFES